MIEVFKTNVEDQTDATMLVEQIHKSFVGYMATFDLEDCDRILRVKSTMTLVNSTLVISLLRKFGFKAAILSDQKPSVIPSNAFWLKF